jgi:hypothetical protein
VDVSKRSNSLFIYPTTRKPPIAVGAVLSFKTIRKFQIMQLQVYRSFSDRTALQDIQAFRLAVKSPYAEYEPEEVTLARNEVKNWASTTAHLNYCGVVPLVPSSIYYAFQLAGYLQGVK